MPETLSPKKSRVSGRSPVRPRRKWLVRVCASLFGITTFAALVSLSLAGLAYAYRGRYYPGVRVGALSLTGMVKAEGEQRVQAVAQQYRDHLVVVSVPDMTQPPQAENAAYPDYDIETTSQQLGLQMGEQQVLEEAWRVGRQSRLDEWLRVVIPALFSGRQYDLSYQVNPEAVQTFVHTQVLPRIVTPQPAKIVVRGSEVAIEDAKAGLTVDEKELTEALLASLRNSGDSDTTYLRAPVKEVDSPITRVTVRPVADRLDSLGQVKVNLKAGEKTVNPTREQVLAWFAPVQNPQGEIEISLNQEAVSTYIKKNCPSETDQKRSLEAIVKAVSPYVGSVGKAQAPPETLQVALTVNLKPSVTATPGEYTAGKFAGKYIEVNLKEQKMYLINGEVLEKTFTVSTGKWSTPTPTGTFAIKGKTKRAYSASYGLYMPYWQNFLNNEYGIHELPEWPNGYKEGENHLGTPVSHGCIRLGVGAAQEVYNWTEDGTPIYIH
jgi:hypothetical protein